MRERESVRFSKGNELKNQEWGGGTSDINREDKERESGREDPSSAPPPTHSLLIRV